MMNVRRPVAASWPVLALLFPALVCLIGILDIQRPLPLPDPVYDRLLAHVAAETPPTATIRLIHNPSVFTYFRATVLLSPRRVVLSAHAPVGYTLTFGGGTARLRRLGA